MAKNKRERKQPMSSQPERGRQDAGNPENTGTEAMPESQGSPVSMPHKRGRRFGHN